MDTRYTQARIRVRERGALVTLVALERYEEFLLDALGFASDPTTRARLNAEVREVRRVVAEAERTIEEHGWNDGQLQQPDAG